MRLPLRNAPLGRGSLGARRLSPRQWLVILVGVAGLAVVLESLAQVALRSSSAYAGGLLVLGLALVAAVGYALARDSSIGILIWLVTAMLNEATHLNGALALDRLAFLALAAAWFVEVVSGRRDLGRFGLTEVLMIAFLALAVASAIAPHALPPIGEDGKDASVLRFIQGGIFFPFAMFVLARQTMTEARAVRRFLWFLVAVGVYLSLTNIFEKNGLQQLVFPRVILDPTVGVDTPDRARGIFLNGAVTGCAIVFSFVAAMYLAVQPRERFRRLALAAAAIMPWALYLTKTRAPWLAALAVVLLGALFAKGGRRWYALVLVAVAVLVALNWSNFSSTDRSKGGVASSNEADDRLNAYATGFWAIGQKPIVGWGIDRFVQVNTEHHKAWGNIDWDRGYGIAAHDTNIGIATELGLLGLGLWLSILVSIGVASRRAWRALPRSGLISKWLVLAFWSSALNWIINLWFIDVRFAAYLNALFFVWAGMVAGLADRAADQGVARHALG